MNGTPVLFVLVNKRSYLQALLFVLPCFIWRSMNSHSGIDVSNIIQASEVFHQADKIEKREKTLGTIVQVMHRYNLNIC